MNFALDLVRHYDILASDLSIDKHSLCATLLPFPSLVRPPDNTYIAIVAPGALYSFVPHFEVV
jgi:hypothetical protein